MLNSGYIVVNIVTNGFKEKGTLYFKKRRKSFFVYLSFQTRKDLALVMEIYPHALVKFENAAVRCFFLTKSLVENIPCTNKTGKTLLFIMYVVVLKIPLILHPGHTSLFLETVRIKFRRSRSQGTKGREKQIL